jgi:hypothetical protein
MRVLEKHATMDVKNNPAGRLQDLLAKARKQTPDPAAKHAWAAVFAVPPEDTGALLQMLADTIALVGEAKAAIQRLTDVDHALYLQPFKKVEALFSNLNLEAGWGQSKQHLDETTLYGLRIAADKLSRVSGYTHIDTAALAALRQDLEALLTEALGLTDLPKDLKELFVRNLEALRRALLAYQVRGIEGLQQELERTVGSLMLHRDQVKAAAAAGGTAAKFLKGFSACVKTVNELLAAAKTARDLVTDGRAAAPALPEFLEI